MKRKIVLSISALLILVEIGASTVVFKSGERQLVASFAGVAAIVALVRDYARPIPRFGGRGKFSLSIDPSN